MSQWTADAVPDQAGRVAIITGANAGLGRRIAERLTARGAEVVMACRNVVKAEEAAESISSAVPGARLVVEQLDLADLSSVEAFSKRYAARHDTLDLLINNAGLMAVDRSRTADGFETQLGVNHLGHFALTGRLLPLLLATTGSRVATMASMGHRPGRMVLDDLMFERRRYDRWAAYFQSKLANLLFTAELQRRLGESGATTIAVAAHPGYSRTDLGVEGHGLSNRMLGVVGLLSQPAPVGALPMLRAATDPGVKGGEFYGPRLIVRGHPVPETPSRRARDASDARELWAASEELVGVRPQFVPGDGSGN